MSESELVLSGGDYAIQAFPLKKGKINLTSGVYSNVKLIKCLADGIVVITWKDGTNSGDLNLSEGDVYSISKCKSLSISSGTFHIV